jgi:hypothetical protein
LGGRRWQTWRGIWDLRRFLVLFALPQGDDSDHASSPSGQGIDDRHDFDQKCREQQQVKANDPDGHGHRHEVDEGLDESPREWLQDKLQSVSGHSHYHGKDHAPSGEGGRAEQGVQFFQWQHGRIFD